MGHSLIQDESSRQQWPAALAAFEMAERDLAPAEEDEEVTFFAGVQVHALIALMTTPAPDAAAFLHKLEIFFQHECWEFSSFGTRGDIHASLLSDAQRLAGEA